MKVLLLSVFLVAQSKAYWFIAHDKQNADNVICFVDVLARQSNYIVEYKVSHSKDLPKAPELYIDVFELKTDKRLQEFKTKEVKGSLHFKV